jgi:poly-beta-1,6-N-acetyl-D-glucosamine synthase
MLEKLFGFGIFWGVWVIAPVLVDGFSAVVTMLAVLRNRYKTRSLVRKVDFFPFVSIIIPVYNSAETLMVCLRSIVAQEYPLDRIEVILIDNGSTDQSFRVFSHAQDRLPIMLTWHSIINQGKAWALNSGIHLCRGNYIFNVDSDVVLHPEAIRNVVATLDAEPDLGAVTGSIQVLPPAENSSRWAKYLGLCEFFEYATAFHVGRIQQTLLRSIYTLSGAFSVFRRDVILETFLYSQDTITEDTDLTFDIYERVKSTRIGSVSEAIAYVHPIESLGALYSQRVRWQRGQIEVSARHPNLMNQSFFQLRGFSPKRVLMVDHTLSFPRFVWTFLLPVLGVFGYPLSLLFWALLMLYIFYTIIDLMWIGVAWLGLDKDSRKRLKNVLWIIPTLPAYRMVIFWFRFSGFLHVMAEPGQWKVEDPVTQVKNGVSQLLKKERKFWENFINK